MLRTSSALTLSVWSLTLTVKEEKGEEYKPLLISDRRSGFPFIETFKIIRTKIEHTAQREKYKLCGNEYSRKRGQDDKRGKHRTCTRTNGKSVLLVDGDLRKPAVAKLLGINASEDGGVYGVINGEKTLAEAIKYSENTISSCLSAESPYLTRRRFSLRTLCPI